jgi:hypothetical protein
MALVIVLVAGCKGQDKAPATGSGSAAAGSGSAVAVATGSGSAGSGSAAAPVGEDPPPACDLAGKYRVRFTWNGTDGYWLRFSVGGTPAAVTLDAEPHMLGLKKKVDAKLDTTACTIAMTHKYPINLKVDPATHLVEGELVRPGEKDPKYAKTPIRGVHDVPGSAPTMIAKPEACLEPGVYEIAIDKKHKWKNTDDTDDRSCKETADMFGTIRVRLEMLGGEVTLDTVEEKAPYREVALVDEVVGVKGCEVTFSTTPEGIQLDTKLTFAPGGKVSGVATRAEYQFVEDGDAGENIWSCETKDMPLTIKRIATP